MYETTASNQRSTFINGLLEGWWSSKLFLSFIQRNDQELMIYRHGAISQAGPMCD